MNTPKTKTTGTMPPLPLQFLAAWLAVWLGRVLQEQVDYLKQENRLLREKLGGKRIRLTDAERRRLATLGKRLGRKGLATIASPETILRSGAGDQGIRGERKGSSPSPEGFFAAGIPPSFRLGAGIAAPGSR